MNTRVCAYCGKEAFLVCNRCESAKYCNVDCQKADWRRHKELCVTPDRLIIEEINRIVNMKPVQTFIGAICHHIGVKQDEVLSCLLQKSEEKYLMTLSVDKKEPHGNYHPVHNNVTITLIWFSNTKELETNNIKYTKESISLPNDSRKKFHESLSSYIELNISSTRECIFYASIDSKEGNISEVSCWNPK